MQAFCSKLGVWNAVVLLMALIGFVVLPQNLKGFNNLNNEGSSRHSNLRITPICCEHPEVHMTTPEIINYYGYEVEVHHVSTKDGYTLEMHRIPGRKGTRVTRTEPEGARYKILEPSVTGNPRGPTFNSSKPPVTEEAPRASKGPIFLQHGHLWSSSAFVLNPGSDSIALLLADSGYDVWLGNFRGNLYSNNHMWMVPSRDEEYWQYSWEEMGLYDLPAMLDYVLNHTNTNKLPYLGYSMGSTAMFLLLSESPQFNDKVSTFIAMAPVAYMGNMSSLIAHLSPFVGLLQIPEYFGFHKIAFGYPMEWLADLLCGNFPRFCGTTMYAINGFNWKQVNVNRLPVYFAHVLDGTTNPKTLKHFAQNILAGKFRKYDYGEEENNRKYGQIDPPDVDLTRITTPVVMLHGEQDDLATMADIELASKYLKNLRGRYKIDDDQFTHIDFLTAINVKQLVYDKILEELRKLE